MSSTPLSPFPSQRSSSTAPPNITDQIHHSSTLVKYHGRACIVPTTDHDYHFVLQKLISLTQDLQKTDMCRNDREWKKFFEDLSTFTKHMMNPDSTIVRYQLEIVNDCLLPYITKLKARFYTDKERVHQLSLIMDALSIQHDTQGIHPAISLTMLEKVREEIRDKQSYFWKSELLGILDPALEKQWRPILLDLKLFLHDVAGKLFAIFLFTVIGWPLAYAYPIYSNSKRLLRVLNEWEAKRKVSSQSIFDLFKTALLIIALLQVMTIVALYQSVGYFCALLASAAVFISLSDSLLKTLAPIVTPYASNYDRFIQHINQLSYDEAMQSIQQSIFSKPVVNHRAQSVEVEVISEPCSKSVATGTGHVSTEESSLEASLVDTIQLKRSHSGSDDDFVMIDAASEEGGLTDPEPDQACGLRQRKH